MSFEYLWRYRERPRFPSRRYLIVWLKRLLTFPGLLRLSWRRQWLRWRGATAGQMTVIESLYVEGSRKHLRIGEHSFIGQRSELFLHEDLRIGDRVVINRGVCILTSGHVAAHPNWRQYHRPVVIEDYAWIAMRAVILPGVTIGRGAVVGAGAVVREDVPAYAIVAGNPAVPLGRQRSKLLDYLPSANCAPHEAWLGRPG
jgi:acetyltransferase-like isoleucine patch superfamily enzyme